jgi:NAD(P)-dependent dehydrogenase (short-subunit alcohol dehydrogenase family)
MTTRGQRTIAIAGAASGIGTAAARRLRAEGHHVITIDRDHADITADLATEPGRWRAIAGVTRLAGGILDGLVEAPILEERRERSGANVVSANYFGRVAFLEGLWSALAASGHGAAILVNTTETAALPRPIDLVQRCLDGAEAEARWLADRIGWARASNGTAFALARYARQQARSPKSRDAGVRLIVIASSVSDVPRLGTDLNDPDIIQGLERFRLAMDSIASRIAFLLGPEAHAWWEATLSGDSARCADVGGSRSGIEDAERAAACGARAPMMPMP